MSEGSAGMQPGRASGVAQVTSLAAPPAGTRSVVGQLIVAGVILGALGVAAGVYAGQRLERRVGEAFGALYDAWAAHGRGVDEAAGRIGQARQQLEQWAALDQAPKGGEVSGVVVISREQASDLAGQLRAARSELDALVRQAAQRQAIVGRVFEEVRRESTATLWALVIGLVAAAVLGGWWLGRAATRPLTRLRRDLETAEQSAQALASALGPWFSRVADGLSVPIQQALEHRSRVEALMGQAATVVEQVKVFDARAAAVQGATSRFAEAADRVREFADESRILALSAALEAARLEAQARTVGVVAEEVRRLAAESREMVRQIGDLRREIAAAAASAMESSRSVAAQAFELREGSVAIQEGLAPLLAGLQDLHGRVRAAARAAASQLRTPASRGSLELRAAVDRALSGSASPAPATEGASRRAAVGPGAGEPGALPGPAASPAAMVAVAEEPPAPPEPVREGQRPSEGSP